MATEKESFIELTERIGRKVGGLSVYPFVSSVKGSPDPVAFLMASHISNRESNHTNPSAICTPLHASPCWHFAIKWSVYGSAKVWYLVRSNMAWCTPAVLKFDIPDMTNTVRFSITSIVVEACLSQSSEFFKRRLRHNEYHYRMVSCSAAFRQPSGDCIRLHEVYSCFGMVGINHLLYLGRCPLCSLDLLEALKCVWLVRVQVRGKAMADKSGDLLDLFHDVLLTARLDDKARFRQVPPDSAASIIGAMICMRVASA